MRIPVTIVDGFFDDPDAVREFALSQPFPNKAGNYPGYRTDPLHVINPELHRIATLRMLSLFYNLKVEHVKWSDASIVFHKMPPSYKSGWIHTDGAPGDPDAFLSGVVYLNPKVSNPFISGTSIYRQINVLEEAQSIANGKKMYDFYKDEISLDEYEKHQKINNDCYEETGRIGNVYNRLALYDSLIPHRPNILEGFTNEDRLTMVAFIKLDSLMEMPMTRLENVSRNS
jgi:hypothetical protein